MNKYVLSLVLLLVIPMSVLAGNTSVVRVSFTIPQRVEINKEAAMPIEEAGKEEERDIAVEEGKVMVIEEAIRQDQRVILKTVLAK